MTLKTIVYCILIVLSVIAATLIGILLFSTAFDFLLCITFTAIAFAMGYRKGVRLSIKNS
ncbi:hypothetical protein [Veillonella sp. VA142]|uniref:hypothetical protein n=1 Tax=Veillonella sp. VA142 TaxID=741834 RepID=UPI000F8D699F|nr:hypothetical protein [Veillonella sp. VA142]